MSTKLEKAKNKVKTYIEEHKEELIRTGCYIAGVAVAALGGCVGLKLYERKLNKNDMVSAVIDRRIHNVLNDIVAISNKDNKTIGYFAGFHDVGFTPLEMGEFGKSLLDQTEIPSDHKITHVILAGITKD